MVVVVVIVKHGNSLAGWKMALNCEYGGTGSKDDVS